MRFGSRILCHPIDITSDFVGFFGVPLMFKALVFFDRILCVSLRVVDAGVFLEVLLRNSVEGERGNRTLQARSCHTPLAPTFLP